MWTPEKESPFHSFVHRSQSYASGLTIANLAGFNNLLFDVTPFKVMSQRAGSKSTEVFGSGSLRCPDLHGTKHPESNLQNQLEERLGIWCRGRGTTKQRLQSFPVSG